MPLEFVDTSSERVAVPDNSILDVGTADFCSMCWFNISTDGDVIISKGRFSNNEPGWAIRKIPSDLLLWVLGDGGGSFDIAGTPGAISLNVWHHAAGVRDTGAVLNRIYLDGAQAGTTAITGSSSGSLDNSDPFLIGAYNSGSGPERFMDGLIEDVRQYSRALSADEILNIYTMRGRDGIVEDLVVRYLMNEFPAGAPVSVAGSVKDSGPNGLNGNPTNTPTGAAGELNFKRRFMVN